MPGTGTDLGSALSLTREQCALKCNEKKECLSFEHSHSQKKCNLNRIRGPTAQSYSDFAFCIKKGIVTCFEVCNRFFKINNKSKPCTTEVTFLI